MLGLIIRSSYTSNGISFFTPDDFSQQLGNLDVSNSYRLKIAKLDPWNAKNYLQLGRNYKSLGQFTLMSEMRTKILSFAPSTEEAKQAISELN